jgi:hypothetical protein
VREKASPPWKKYFAPRCVGQEKLVSVSLKFSGKPPVKNQTTRIRLNCELRTRTSFQKQG